jgi:membrane protein
MRMDTEPSAPTGQPEPATTSLGDRAARRRFDVGTERIVARVAQTKERIDASRVGHVQRRFVQADLANQAMILAALALSLMLPVLVTLAALVPLGAANSLPAVAGARLGLHASAVADLQHLFPSQAAVRGSSTVLGTLFTLVSAYAWPTALQRGYEIAWGVTSRGWRGLWRPLVWLVLFMAVGAVLLALPRSGLADPWRTILLLVFWTPIIFVWSWWTQHFLLRGAVGWWLLVPGAIAMTVGLVAVRAFAAVWLSTAISYNYARYGPLGIVFMLLTWLIALSIIMLGGPVLGAALHERRTQQAASQQPASQQPAERAAELLAGLRERAAQVVPPPRAPAAERPVERPDEERAEPGPRPGPRPTSGDVPDP